MKSRILQTFIFLILLTARVYPQNEPTDKTSEVPKAVNFGINLSYTALLPNHVVAATPGFVLNFNKFSFLIGPRTYLDNNTFDKSKHLRGIQVSCRFFPNGITSEKRFNFYFLYDFAFSIIITEHSHQIYHHPDLQHYISKCITTVNYITNHIGYGFQLKIIKGFYINQSLQLGIAHYSDKLEIIVPDKPILSEEVSSSQEPAFDAMIRIGLGYNF
ncbi:MAG: hypothetical protein KAT38_05605 [Bacteroidales bacterium]|nr:hypothetical protein [Bacteroidales bacterium]